jgi:hypothetical protein
MFKTTIKEARRLAKIGPRVSAILKINSIDPNVNGTYKAVPGFMDNDTGNLKQVVLVTPDGRLWVPMSEAAVLEVNK